MYLPRTDLAEAGVDEADIRRGDAGAPFLSMMRQQIERAESCAKVLEQLDAAAEFPDVAMTYAQGVRAAIAHSRGELEGAMEELRGILEELGEEVEA